MGALTKYAPLGVFLQRQIRAFVPMTFVEIEKVLGRPLPKSQQYPAWWSNNPDNNVMTRVWLDAGYVTEQVDVVGRKLVFRRTKKSASAPQAALSQKPAPSQTPTDRHPLFGWMKGTAQIPPGVDLTEPADPEWGKNAGL